jgi:subtilisin family serine protease
MISATILMMLSPYVCQAAELLKHPESQIPGEYTVMLKEPMLRANHNNMDEDGNSIVTSAIERAEYIMLEDFLENLASKAEETPAFLENGDILPVFTLNHKYHTPGMLGFSAHLDETMLAYVLQHEAVDYVEEDEIIEATQNSGCTRQLNAQWGLGRTTRSGTSTTYDFHNNAGRGVDVYVLDSGIRRTHTEFEGRATFGMDATTSRPPRNDPNGHGTHVASSVGGRLHGVAKFVNMIDVRVLGADGRGSNSGIIAGINWVAQQCRARGRTCIANLSLGGDRSRALNSAIDAATGNRVLSIVASGNDASDACDFSPASAATALTVNNADSRNRPARSTNFGRCTHIWAPGSSIRGAGHRSNTEMRTLSGTSMAAPHVAGVAAKRLALNPTMSVSQLRSAILDRARTGMMQGELRRSPNSYVRMTC